MSIAPPQLSVDIMLLLNEASGQLAHMKNTANGVIYRICLVNNWYIHNIRLIAQRKYGQKQNKQKKTQKR